MSVPAIRLLDSDSLGKLRNDDDTEVAHCISIDSLGWFRRGSVEPCWCFGGLVSIFPHNYRATARMLSLRYIGVSALLTSLHYFQYLESILGFYSIFSLAAFGTLIHFNIPISGKLLGKNVQTGQLHPLSFLVHFPFHILNHLTLLLYRKLLFRKRIPGNEVSPGFWLGGIYAHKVETLAKFTANDTWACVVDLTSEFNESATVQCKNYLNVPTWDGCPPSIEEMERCAEFVLERYRGNGGGKVLVHCAHGVGRSTLVMCAVLVKVGRAKNTKEAFELIKANRPVAHLNKKMSRALVEWEKKYAT